MSNDKTTLQATLGKLLGFDDGSEDVLEHLLSIESKDVSVCDSSKLECFDQIRCPQQYLYEALMMPLTYSVFLQSLTPHYSLCPLPCVCPFKRISPSTFHNYLAPAEKN